MKGILRPASFRIPPTILTLVLVFLSGCGEEGPRQVPPTHAYFPELRDTALVVMNLSLRESDQGGGCFFIDRFETTNREYLDFLKRSGYRPSDPLAFLDHWEKGGDFFAGSIRAGEEDLPVIFVNFEDARAFARHYGKELPTVRQWLGAAIGADGSRSFPWGNRFMSFFCNSWRSRIYGPARVGTFENGKSPCGCYDMIGNVAEWSLDAVPGVVEPSHFVMGGSWSDGGTQDADFYFDLTPPPGRKQPFKEETCRTNTLGFRCVRNDALPFIRDVLTKRISALSPDERMEALDELAPLYEPLYDVLKFLQFDHSVVSKLPVSPIPSSIGSIKIGGEETVWLCYDQGFLGGYSLRGECLWHAQIDAEDAPYGFHTLPGDVEGGQRIITRSLWKNRVSVRNAADGSLACTVSGPVNAYAQSLTPYLMADLGSEGFLVGWYREDRLQRLPIRTDAGEPALIGTQAFLERIDFLARCLLPRESFDRELRVKRLAFFTTHPEKIDLDAPSRFRVDNFGPPRPGLTNALKNRFRIQLWEGGYSYLEENLEPDSQLALYDAGTGVKRWSLDFPQIFPGYRGVLKRSPMLLRGGEWIALQLEEDDPFKTRLCLLDGKAGTMLDYSDIDTRGKRLDSLVPVDSSSLKFLGILESRELLCFDMGDRNRSASTGITVGKLLESTDACYHVHDDGTLSKLDGFAVPDPENAMPESFDPLAGPLISTRFRELLKLQASSPPWLLAGAGADVSSLLFLDWQKDRFKKAFLLDGVYDRYYRFRIEGAVPAVYLLLWGSSGEMACFSGGSGELLWKQSIGGIAETEPVLADLDGDGVPEAVMASPSGEIRAIDLKSGQKTITLRCAGSAITFLHPVARESEAALGLLLGLEGAGVWLVDATRSTEAAPLKDLITTLGEFEKWRSRQSR